MIWSHKGHSLRVSLFLSDYMHKRASPSSAIKNIINHGFGIDCLVISVRQCVDSACYVLGGQYWKRCLLQTSADDDYSYISKLHNDVRKKDRPSIISKIIKTYHLKEKFQERKACLNLIWNVFIKNVFFKHADSMDMGLNCSQGSLN